MSLGVSGDAPQMYEQLEQKLGSGNDIANLPDMRVAHYCPYKEDLGLRLAVARLAGLTKAFDEKYVQVLLQVRNEVSRKILTNISFTQLVNLDSPKKALARVLSQHIVPTANLRSPQWCDASIPAGVIKNHATKTSFLKNFSQSALVWLRPSCWPVSTRQRWSTLPAGTRSLRGGSRTPWSWRSTSRKPGRLLYLSLASTMWTRAPTWCLSSKGLQSGGRLLGCSARRVPH